MENTPQSFKEKRKEVKKFVKNFIDVSTAQERLNSDCWESPHGNVNGWQVAFIALAVLIVLAVFTCFAGHGAEITEDQGVHCILGEARGEGYESLLAHAEALRNRGSTQGVYGCNANYSKEMPFLRSRGILTQAERAWRESEHTNSVKGAKFWGSLLVDGKWIEKMKRSGYIRTAVVNNTAFYRDGSK